MVEHSEGVYLHKVVICYSNSIIRLNRSNQYSQFMVKVSQLMDSQHQVKVSQVKASQRRVMPHQHMAKPQWSNFERNILKSQAH